MVSDILTPPSPNEIEISIFGAGVGESLAIHIGGGHWILVDSCHFPKKTTPASLNYLRNLNVDIENSVSLIVASHWHRDHIRGMDMLLEQCRNAQFAITGAIGGEFQDLVSLYEKASPPELSLTRDVSKVFSILKKRKGQIPQLAISDRTLLQKDIRIHSGSVKTSVHSLSPSDGSIGKSFAALNNQLKTGNPSCELKPNNHPSVVLWISVDDNHFLLGGDLECTNDSRTGWSAILDSSQVISNTDKAQVFKIPHHGSENAHHSGVWESMLEKKPLALITPFRSGRKPLPSADDCARIMSLTPRAYATAPTSQSKFKLRDKGTARSFKEATKTSNNLYHKSGQVRIRKTIDEENKNWQVSLFGDAYQLK